MLILSSNGFSSKELIEEVKNYLPKMTSKAAIITTASIGYKEKDRHIPRLTEELESLDLAVEYFDIDVQDPILLTNYDLIEINGGNPFYLLKQMKVTNCKRIFEQLMKDKVIVGISAGSVVLQNSIKLIAGYSPEMNQDVRITDLSGMGLTEVEILPHYHRFISRFENFEERARQYEMDNQCSVTRIDDGQALFITDKKKYVI